MGYRSDVTAVFYVKDEKHLPVLKLWLDENFPMDTFENSIRWFNKGMLVEEQNVKWYDDYEEVKAFDTAARRYLRLMHNTDAGDGAPSFCYEFVRIGEDYDDIDAQHEGIDCEWLLSVNREIVCDVGYTNERDV